MEEGGLEEMRTTANSYVFGILWHIVRAPPDMRLYTICSSYPLEIYIYLCP